MLGTNSVLKSQTTIQAIMDNNWTQVVSKSNKRRAGQNREVVVENATNNDEKCTFCGCKLHECGGDHYDEMREITRRHTKRR
jgi:hypothetical protein